MKHLTSEFGFAPVDLGTLREGGRLIQLGGPCPPSTPSSRTDSTHLPVLPMSTRSALLHERDPMSDQTSTAGTQPLLQPVQLGASRCPTASSWLP
ncbi:hypothetical protein NKH77_52265 [Streptomyces sp. M19]